MKKDNRLLCDTSANGGLAAIIGTGVAVIAIILLVIFGADIISRVWNALHPSILALFSTGNSYCTWLAVIIQ